MWLLDIFGRTCTVSVITMVLACDCDCVVSSIVALTTSYIRVLHFCGQVPFLYVIIVGCIHTCMHTYMHTYLPTYHFTYTHTYTHIHTYIHTILPSRSFTTSFVFPSFPVPAKTIEAHFRKKLTCGVIRSFNLQIYLPVVPHKAVAEVSEIGNL